MLDSDLRKEEQDVKNVGTHGNVRRTEGAVNQPRGLGKQLVENVQLLGLFLEVGVQHLASVVFDEADGV